MTVGGLLCQCKEDYSLNEKRLQENRQRLKELEAAVALVKKEESAVCVGSLGFADRNCDVHALVAAAASV